MSEKRFLNDEQKFQLYRYLELNKERLQKDRPDWKNAIEEVSRELQFPVTETNLKTACRVCNVPWEPKVNDKGGVVGWMKALRNHVATLDSDIQRLTGELNTIHGRLREVEQENQRLRVGMNNLYA